MLSFLKADFKIVHFEISKYTCGIQKVIVFICFLISGIFFLQSTPVFAQTQAVYKGIVNTFKLNIRQRPSLDANIVMVTEKGEVVDVLNKKSGEGSWLKVVYKGNKGYVRNRPQYITLIPVPVKSEIQKEKTKTPVKNIKVTPTPENVPNKKAVKKKTSKKKEIQDKIQTQEKMVKSFSQKEVEIIEGLNEIDFKLNKARLKVTTLSKEAIELERKIGKLSLKREGLASQIELNQGYAGKRLNALYKMNMIGRLDAAGLPSSVFDFFLQQNAMKRIITADFNMLETQGDDLKRFEILESELKKEVALKEKLETALNDQIRINKKETLKKELILKEIQKKKELSLAAVEALKKAQVQLDGQIASLQPIEIIPKTQSSFSNYKGRLTPPVKGKIISAYGPSRTGDDKSFTFQKGIDIKVERGEPVKSIFHGKVMFARWLKGYGNLMIIDHGENYYTLYAHVEEIFKNKGESVKTGEVIATAGDTGSIKGPRLHFEIRHHGKPENPMKWLKKGV